MNGIIYMFRNKTNNMIYIGQTINPVDRYREHITSKYKEHSYIDNAIYNEGAINFEYTVICEVKGNTIEDVKEQLNSLEMMYIKKYNCVYPNGYNLTEGGNATIFSEESKKKMSKSHLGHIVTEETRKKISSSSKGKTKTEEWKAKISKKVYQYDKNNNLIKIWESVSSTSNGGYSVGNVGQCCLGKRKTHKGFIWSYINLNN